MMTVPTRLLVVVTGVLASRSFREVHVVMMLTVPRVLAGSTLRDQRVTAPSVTVTVLTVTRLMECSRLAVPGKFAISTLQFVANYLLPSQRSMVTGLVVTEMTRVSMNGMTVTVTVTVSSGPVLTDSPSPNHRSDGRLTMTVIGVAVTVTVRGRAVTEMTVAATAMT
jgi:hypothetical protein